MNPFIVHITEDSREPQVWRVFDDRPLQFYFKIVKKDAQTREIVLDNSASYKIYDVNAGEYVEMIVRYPKKETVSVFQTNKKEYLITPEQLKCGIYRIEEVQTPSSYVAAGFENALVSDGIEIPLNEVTAGGKYQSAGKAAITITVDSNTVHQIEEETGKFIVVVEQYNDEAVGSLTLNKQGEKLKEAVKVEDQFLSKVKNSVASVVNEVSEFITGEEAMDKSSGYEFSYEMGGIKGAEFAVYAKETIYTPDGQTDAEGSRIVRYNENDLVATLITGTDGKAVLNNLPIGKYYLVEEKAGQNCILDTEATEKGYVRAEDVSFVVEETGEIQKVEMKDDYTKVSVSKTDITDGKEIQGAKLQIIDEEGNVVEEWTTGEEHLIEYLPTGTYTLHEEAAIDGYVVAEDVEFTVLETGEALEGVEFTLYEKESGKEAAVLVTDKDGNAETEQLSIGIYENGKFKETAVYVLKETKPLEGYEKAEEECALPIRKHCGAREKRYSLRLCRFFHFCLVS